MKALMLLSLPALTHPAGKLHYEATIVTLPFSCSEELSYSTATRAPPHRTPRIHHLEPVDGIEFSKAEV